MTKTILLITIFVMLFGFTNGQNTLPDTIKIDEVVVTGSKTEISRKLVPVSVSQISQEKIENTGEINILPTISNYVPGVFVTERNVLGFGVSTGGSGAISVRGVSGSPNTRVLVMLDGHPQYQGIFGHPLPDAYVASDVKTVEVIRGPGSILYGSNAMGGVVNIITKKQLEDGFKMNINASYGSYNTKKYCQTVGYKKNKLAVYASVNHDETDGIRDSTDFKIMNGYAKVNYDFTNHYKISADFNISQFDANDNGSIYESPKPFGIDIMRAKAAISVENSYDKIDGALKLYHNFGEHDLTDGWHSTDNNTGAMLYQTMRFFKGNSITVGTDFKQFGGEGNSGMAKDSLIHIDEFAVYAYIQQTIKNKLTLSAGARVENNSKFGNILVPMAGFAYNPFEQTTFKGSVSKGFRSPTVTELYLFAPNKDLEPEEMMNYEISWLQSFANNKLTTEVTLFMADGENMIQTVGKYPNVTRQNIGEFSNKGVEVAINYFATKNIIINTNYSFIDTDEPVLASPKHHFNFSANYSQKYWSSNFSVQHVEDLYSSTSPEIKTNYTLVNLRLVIKPIKYFDFFLSMNNILGEKYEINYGYPMPETNFMAGVNIKL